MPLLGESNTRQGFSGAVGGYEIENSAVFNGSDEGLVRTNSGTATGAAKKFTLSWWWKDATYADGTSYDDDLNYYHVGNSGSNWIQIGVGAGAAAGDWEFNVYSKGSSGVLRTDYSNKNFRDPHGWHHFVVAIDTNAATAAANRKLMYHNGVLMTKRASSNFADDETFPMMTTGNDTRWAYMGSGQYMSGYLTHCALIDGQQLTPTSFGEFDSNGIWRPIDLTGLTFGTYGYWLKYEDASNLGLDSSGNSNNFTATNMAASNQTSDTPTRNFAILSSLTMQNGSHDNLTLGNLKTQASSDQGLSFSSFPVPSGKKIYVEATCAGATTTMTGCVKATSAVPQDPTSDFDALETADGGAARLLHVATGDVFNSDGNTTVSNYAPNDSVPVTHMIALDLVGDKIYWGDAAGGASGWSNGTGSYNQTFDNASGVSLTAGLDWFFAFRPFSGNITVNFGATAFTVAAPDGYETLKVDNLPEPAIKDPSAHFQAVTYTGNGTAIGSGGLSVNQDGNSTFQPDLVWIKNYDTNSTSHILTDSVRGATKNLNSNSAGAESTDTEALSTFDTDGFTVGSDNNVNASSDGHVAWMWKAADAWNESSFGSNGLASSGRRNTTAGFSIANWTHRTSGNYAIKHGLSITPEFFIIKSRNDVSASGTNWELWHKDLVDTGKRIIFDSGTEISAYWADASDSADGTGSYADIGTGESPVTASLFALQDGDLTGTDAVMGYFWHSIAGYSKFGKYIGNGNAASRVNPFIDLGFEPALIFLRRSGSNGDHWAVYDNKRPNSYEQGNSKGKDKLNWNSTHDHTAIGTFDIDFLANGFKIRNDNTHDNASGGTYIYGAWAHAPFGGADTTEGTGV